MIVRTFGALALLLDLFDFFDHFWPFLAIFSHFWPFLAYEVPTDQVLKDRHL